MLPDDLLRIENLTISVLQNNKYLPVVKNISFTVPKGKSVGILGESGCGKSLTGGALLRVLPHPLVKVESGEIFFDGEAVHSWDYQKFNKHFRWRKASIIFQEASASLNPVVKVGKQFTETLRKVAVSLDKAESLLKECGLPDAKRVLHSYPYELSGGMKQRVLIAMALAGNPELLVADEPTTATDATVQDQILDLLLKIQKARGMSIIFISHDFRLIQKMCYYVYVMYCGRIIERQLTSRFLQQPHHPYTKALIASRLTLKTPPKVRLKSIKGTVPPIANWHKGCSFFDRCERRQQECQTQEPPLVFDDLAGYACWHPLSR